MNTVVIGGGLAGAAAACRLARAGHAVTVLEREAGPVHKVCGEFLSGEALADLAALGVDAAALGAAPIGALRLVHRGRAVETRLPFAASGLSRLVLDEALLRRAAQLGAEIRRGVRVRSLEEALAAGGPVLLATGKHDLRGAPRTAAEPEALIGFKLHLRLRPAQRAALAGHVEVVLFAGGYAGLQLIEDGIANLCLLVDRSRFDAAGQTWPALLAALQREDAHLACRLEGADALWDRPLSIFRVPYGYLHAGAEQDGAYRLGDQAAVIPSFCGDGMAIALHTARLAAEAVLGGRDAASYHQAMRREAGPPVRLAYGLYQATRSRAVRAAVLGVAGAWPGLLRGVARRTRVSRSDVTSPSSVLHGRGPG